MSNLDRIIASGKMGDEVLSTWDIDSPSAVFYSFILNCFSKLGNLISESVDEDNPWFLYR